MRADSGLVKRETLWLALLVFPATVGGAWLGARAYRVLSDHYFRDILPGLLFLSGVTLVLRSLDQIF